MKKKILAILLVLVLAATVIVATACDDSGLIVKNEKRDFTRITASVTYNGRASQVSKLDLNATINNWLVNVANNYGSSYYQEALKQIRTSYNQANESLAETEAYRLMCIDEFYKRVMAGDDAAKKALAEAANTTGKAYNVAARIKEIETVLPEDQLIEAIKNYNADMQTGFDSFREAYEKEIENRNNVSKSTENIKSLNLDSLPWKLVYEKGEELLENGLKVSVTYDDKENTTVELDRDDYTVTGFSSDEVKDKVTVTVTFGEETADFDVKIVKAQTSRPAMPKEDEDEEEEEDEEVKEMEEKLKAALAASKEKGYSDFYEVVEDARFEVELERKIKLAKDGNETTEPDLELYKVLKEAKRRLEKQLDANYRTYDYYFLEELKSQVVSAYEDLFVEDAEASEEAIVQAYNEKIASQTEALRLGTKTYKDIADSADVKTQIVHEDGGYFYVGNLLLGLTDELKELYDSFKADGASEKALKDYAATLIEKIAVIVSNPEYDKDAKCEEEECTCTACKNYQGENPGPCTNEDCTCEKCPNKRFITEDYAAEHGINLNEDNMIDWADMIAAIYEDLGTVGSTDEERAEIIKKFKKLVYMANDDEGFFDKLSGDYAGYYLNNEESEWVESFTRLSRALANGPTEAEIAEFHIVGTGVGSYGYCPTDYGYHVVMLFGYAMKDKAAATDLGNGLYALPLDAITDYGAYEPAEEEGEPAKGTIKYGIKETLDSTVKDAAKGNVKDSFQKGALKDASKTTIKYYKDIYEDLIEQYED